jgi:hypothetical protein
MQIYTYKEKLEIYKKRYSNEKSCGINKRADESRLIFRF